MYDTRVQLRLLTVKAMYNTGLKIRMQKRKFIPKREEVKGGQRKH
jgi:hypothetical protein